MSFLLTTLLLCLFHNGVLALTSTNVCAPCTSGNYSYANFVGVCPVGSYDTSSGTAAAACDVCPFGTYLASSSSSSMCTQCSAGRFSSYTTNTTLFQVFSKLSIPLVGGNSGTSSVIRMYVSGIGSLLTNIRSRDTIIATQLIFSSATVDESDGTSLNTSWYAPSMDYTIEMMSLTTSSKLQVRLDITQRNLISCQDCQAGSYSSVGASTCTLCDIGQSSVGGSSACAPCAPGRYSASSGTTECALCDYGKFTNPDWPGQSSCDACGVGYYADQLGSTSCRRCGDGFSSDRGASTCYACTPGKYSSFNETAMWCFPCDAGTYSNSGASVCTKCSAGKYVMGTDEGQSICKDCLPGTFAANNGSVSCEICPSLTISSVGSTTCTMCDPLMSTGTFGQVACYCKPGYGSIESNRQCMQCTGNTYSVGSVMQCTECWGVASSDHSKCDCPADRPILRSQTCLSTGCNSQCNQQPGGCTNPQAFVWTYPVINGTCPLTSKLLVVQSSQCQGIDPVSAYQWELSNPRAPGYTFGCQSCPAGTWTDRSSSAAYQCNQCQKAPIGVNITAPAQFRVCSCMAGYGDYAFNLGICSKCPVNYYQPPVNQGGPCLACPFNTYAAPGSSVCKPIVCPPYQYLLPDGYSVADCRPCDSLTTNPVETPLRGCSCKFGYGNFNAFTGQCMQCQQPTTFSAGGFDSYCSSGSETNCYDQVFAYSYPSICQPPLEFPLAGYSVAAVSKPSPPTFPGTSTIIKVGRLIPGVSDVSHVTTLCVNEDGSQRQTVPWVTLKCVSDYTMPHMAMNEPSFDGNNYDTIGNVNSGATWLRSWPSQFPNSLPVLDLGGNFYHSFSAQNTINTRLARFLSTDVFGPQIARGGQIGFTCTGNFFCPATTRYIRRWRLSPIGILLGFDTVPCTVVENVQIDNSNLWAQASYFDATARFYFYQEERATYPRVSVIPGAMKPSPLNPDGEIGIQIVYGVYCNQCRMARLQVVTKESVRARLATNEWITIYEVTGPFLDQIPGWDSNIVFDVQAGTPEGHTFYDAPGWTQLECVRDNILSDNYIRILETDYQFEATFYPMFQSVEGGKEGKWVPMSYSVQWKATRKRQFDIPGFENTWKAQVPDSMTYTITSTSDLYPTWDDTSSGVLKDSAEATRRVVKPQKTYNNEECWLRDWSDRYVSGVGTI